jgi:hypothetical protein
MASEHPKIFISYSRDSAEHVQRVLRLANRLREDGIDCRIDQYVVVPEEGWRLWTERQIRDSDFVLLVCTETYRQRFMDEEEPEKGLIVRLEGRLIYNSIYQAQGRNTKFVPVLFESGDSSHIPDLVRDPNSYRVQTEDGYEDLYRRLTNQPRIIKPKLGQRRSLPPRERKSEGTAEPDEGLSRRDDQSTLHPKQSITEGPNLKTRIRQPTPTDSKARVFVSHSSKDKPFVRKLVEALNKHLLDIWVDEHEIKVGDSLDREVFLSAREFL